jgi:hypothetical protein
MPLLAPLTILAGWLVERFLWKPWERLPPEQVGELAILLLAVFDLFFKMITYAVGTIVEARLVQFSRMPAWRVSLVFFLILALTEFALRYWGASASLGGDLYYRVSRRLGLSPLGFAFIPAVGAIAGWLASLILWRGRVR